MNDKTTNDPIIIFHRTQTNSKEALEDQKIFIESYLKHLPIITIDYISGNYRTSDEIFHAILQDKNRITAIIQSPFPRKEYHLRYDRYNYFNFCKAIGKMDIYLMDGEGRLYKEVGSIEDVITKL